MYEYQNGKSATGDFSLQLMIIEDLYMFNIFHFIELSRQKNHILLRLTSGY